MKKKNPFFECTFLHQYSIPKKTDYPTTPSTHSIAQWDIFLNFQMVLEKLASPFCHFLGVSNQRKSSLCRDLIFLFVLVHTQVQVRNYYNIIYTKETHNLTWTSLFYCLIGLLLFFNLKFTIIYNDTTSPCFFYVSKILLTYKKSSKLLEWIIIKYINNYKCNNYFVQYKL